MRGFLRLASLAAVGVAALTSAAGAQALGAGTVAQATPYVGYMVFGNYLNGPLGTSLSSSTAPVYGVQLGLKLAPNVALIGNVATASGDLTVGIPFLGSHSVGTNSLILYDAGLELGLGKLGTGGLGLSPFVQGGIGQIRYDVKAASILETHATNVAYNLGGGADIAVGKDMAIRLMAKDYIGKFNFQQATSLDVSGDVAHNLAFSAGLRVDF